MVFTVRKKDGGRRIHGGGVLEEEGKEGVLSSFSPRGAISISIWIEGDEEKGREGGGIDIWR